jgi:putative endonuclease
MREHRVPAAGAGDLTFSYVYLLVLSNGCYYAGFARDMRERYRRHIRGTGSRLTRSFPPVRLAQCWQVRGGRSQAQKVEAFIKSCSRSDKRLLVSDPNLLGVWLQQRGGSRIRPKPWRLDQQLSAASY